MGRRYGIYLIATMMMVAALSFVIIDHENEVSAVGAPAITIMLETQQQTAEVTRSDNDILTFTARCMFRSPGRLIYSP